MNTAPAIGCRVMIVTIPQQVLSDRNKVPETMELFRKAVGRSFTVRGVNEYGMAEFWLGDKGLELSTDIKHTIWVEPEYLQVEAA